MLCRDREIAKFGKIILHAQDEDKCSDKSRFRFMGIVSFMAIFETTAHMKAIKT